MSRVTLHIDGHPARTFRNDLTNVVDVLKRLDEDWYFSRGGAGLDQDEIYHWHGRELEDHGVVSGCFRGSMICMYCGSEVPESIRGIVFLQKSAKNYRRNFK